MSAPPETAATAQAESPVHVKTEATDTEMSDRKEETQVESGETSVQQVNLHHVHPSVEAPEVHPTDGNNANIEGDVNDGPVDGVDTNNGLAVDGHITDGTTESGTVDGETPGPETDLTNDEQPGQLNNPNPEGDQPDPSDGSDNSDSSSDVSSDDDDDDDESDDDAEENDTAMEDDTAEADGTAEVNGTVETNGTAEENGSAMENSTAIANKKEDCDAEMAKRREIAQTVPIPDHFMTTEDNDDNGPDQVMSEPLRTKNEQDHLPLPKPTLKIADNANLIPIGPIHSIVGTLVTILAGAEASAEPLDAGTVVCLGNKTVIGAVMDTFGPASKPFYVVGFENIEEIALLGLEKGKIVYHPQGHAQHIRVSDIQKLKGYDTSNRDDEEEENSDGFFSDDQDERAHLAKAPKNARSGAGPGSRRGPAFSRGGQTGRPGNANRGDIGNRVFAVPRGRGGKGARGGQTDRQGRGDRNRGQSDRQATASNLDYDDSADYTPLRRPTTLAPGQSLPPRPVNTGLPATATRGPASGREGYSGGFGGSRNDRGRHGGPGGALHDNYQGRQDSGQPSRQNDGRGYYGSRNNSSQISDSEHAVAYNGRRDSYSGYRDPYNGGRDSRDAGRNEPHEYGRRHDDFRSYDNRPLDRDYRPRHESRYYDQNDGHAQVGYAQGGYNNAQSPALLSAMQQPAGAYSSGLAPPAQSMPALNAYINPATGQVWGQPARPTPGLGGVPGQQAVAPQQSYQPASEPPPLPLQQVTEILARLRQNPHQMPYPPPMQMPVSAHGQPRQSEHQNPQAQSQHQGHHDHQVNQGQPGQQGQHGQHGQQGQQQHRPGDAPFNWGQQFSRYQ